MSNYTNNRFAYIYCGHNNFIAGGEAIQKDLYGALRRSNDLKLKGPKSYG